MKRNETFFWYDLETFGLNSRYDRIAQFAGVRTDMDLAVIEDPIVLYCKLSDDYLPDPLACMVTGITPQEVEEKGLIESDFIARINDIFSKRGTCAVGYNSLRFDDEFIRNALYRNFLDPYQREYDQGRSRWDLIDLVRAAHDLRPKGIVWPKKPSSNRPSFKLTDLTEANGISHEHAHDAMSDVWATLELARLIKRKQPKLFSYYLDLRNKQKVKQELSTPMGPPVLYTGAEFTREEGCSTVVVPITGSYKNKNSIFVFDLRNDPSMLISAAKAYGELEEVRKTEDTFRTIAQRARKALLEKENLEQSLQETTESLTEAANLLANLPSLVSASDRLLRVPGLYRVSINRVPFISPLKILTEDPAIATHLGLDLQVCEKHRRQLAEHPILAVNIRKAADSDEYPPVDDVDFALYSGFFGDADAQRFSQIRDMEPEELLRSTITFDDPRASELLWRYIRRNWPHVLDEKEQQLWHEFCENRLNFAPGDTLVNLEFYARKITERLTSQDTREEDKAVMEKLEQWGKALCSKLGISYPK
ncbi:exodeoxyribonuclease I [Pleomorphochaeta sp. DL1XJH-081]|jgi:exodeoxyribonuclease-1|uniref:exodeoxyribonuclease I n=1 Tax=Pleomorphochaeta sp. DL1XJH-081 TaxID=3409690 RepID=UPI003BB7D971